MNSVMDRVREFLDGRPTRPKCLVCMGPAFIEKGPGGLVIVEGTYCDHRVNLIANSNGEFEQVGLDQLTGKKKKKASRSVDHLMTCKVPRCRQQAKALALCEEHLALYQQRGETNIEDWIHKMRLRPQVARSRSRCQIKGCGAPVHCRELCTKHYARWKASGRPPFDQWVKQGGPLPPKKPKEHNQCQIKGCDNKGGDLALCRKHYRRWVRAGRPEMSAFQEMLESSRQIKRCDVPNCDRKSEIQGLCRKHYSKWVRCGRPELESCLDMLVDTPSQEKKCLVPGCDTKHKSRGLCMKHYGAWRDCAAVTPGLTAEQYIKMGGPKLSEYKDRETK